MRQLQRKSTRFLANNLCFASNGKVSTDIMDYSNCLPNNVSAIGKSSFNNVLPSPISEAPFTQNTRPFFKIGSDFHFAGQYFELFCLI